MGEHWPIVLIEVILVFGGVLAFGWWQLRSVKRDREAAQARRAQAAAQPADADESALPTDRDKPPLP